MNSTKDNGCETFVAGGVLVVFFAVLGFLEWEEAFRQYASSPGEPFQGIISSALLAIELPLDSISNVISFVLAQAFLIISFLVFMFVYMVEAFVIWIVGTVIQFIMFLDPFAKLISAVVNLF